MAERAIPPKDSASAFNAQHGQPDYRKKEPAKEKTKTRPEGTSASAALHARYATAFANFTIDDEINEAEKPPPILYRLKPGSIEAKMVRIMLPDPNEDVSKDKSSVDWINFVGGMTAFGFRAEHRGGSVFTFGGDIMLPDNTLAPQKRSFNVHRPHPDTEMGPILLHSLGRRCNRRFGWQRGNFAVQEKSVEQGI